MPALQWMNHTGFVVEDIERSLAFYRDLLGLQVERDGVMEGDFISNLTGFADARLRIVYLGNGDGRHSVELIQYLNPVGARPQRPNRNDVGVTHLGIIVDDLESLHRSLSAKGVSFVSPPAYRSEARYPWAACAAYVRDPDGNYLEFIERAPAPPGETRA
ncbi:MAG: VOC family protein [Dehalococcoidia bacterium]|nr:VOC family protein [Dehalococcoidia bacterium]